MNRGFVLKLGAIGLLILLLLIPLMCIGGLIAERQQLRDKVVQDIARSSSYSQRITGPILVVPYRKTVRQWQERPQTRERYLEEREVAGQLYFLPQQFNLDSEVKTGKRSRGIYQALVYRAGNRISGHFAVPEKFGLGAEAADYRLEPAFVTLGVSDIRGIENALNLRVNGRAVPFQPGSGVGWLGAGVHAPQPGVDGSAALSLNFELDMKLQGTGQFEITPIGRESQVTLKADWPHPSFTGDYLPVEHTINDRGFSARWRTSFFSTNLREAVEACAYQSSCDEFKSRRFGIDFIDPVDQYLKTERAIKYALLFIVLTFAGFFLFEVLKKLAVHPIQYGLVGLALAVFYLLLLSLSEHIDFAYAYLLSSASCVALLGFYLGHVLQSFGRGMGFAAALASLYALLYGLLRAEDYALLMGSLLVFGLLGATMILTRKVNWFSLQREAPETGPKS